MDVSLMGAAASDDPFRAELALLHGEPVNGTDKKNRDNPLLEATKHGSLRALQVMLRAEGVEVDPRDLKNNRTPLHIACERGDMKVASELHTFGANIEARNKYNELPIQSAEITGTPTQDVLDVFANRRLLELIYSGGLRPKTKRTTYKWEEKQDLIESEKCEEEIFDPSGTIVIDGGTTMTKAGPAGATFPWILQRTVVGLRRADTRRASSKSTMQRDSKASSFAWGWRASVGQRELYPVQSRPIRRGLIQRWDQIQQLWTRAARQATGKDPDGQTIALVESRGLAPTYRERLAELTFEGMRAGGLYLALHPRVALYNSGRCSGCVLDCGGGTTHAVPIFRAVEQRKASLTSNLCGELLTRHVAYLLDKKLRSEDRIDHWRPMLMTLAEHVKMTCCDVWGASDDVTTSSSRKSYTLPDGTTLSVGKDMSTCGDILFTPALVDPGEAGSAGESVAEGQTRRRRESIVRSRNYGIHQLLARSIAACRQNIRKDMIHNIVATGGSSNFPGLDDRLSKELGKLTRQKSLTIHRSKCPDLDAWTGTSLLASLSTFRQSCLTRAQYDEEGSSAVERHAF